MERFGLSEAVALPRRGLRGARRSHQGLVISPDEGVGGL